MTRFERFMDFCNEHPIATILIVGMCPVVLFLPLYLIVLDETD